MENNKWQLVNNKKKYFGQPKQIQRSDFLVEINHISRKIIPFFNY